MTIRTRYYLTKFLQSALTFSSIVFFLATAVAHAASSQNSKLAKSMVDRWAQRLSHAKAIEYEAVVTAGQVSNDGVVGTPNVYTVKCNEQEPNCFRITVSNHDGIVAEFASNSSGGVFYDVSDGKYLKFRLNSDADWAKLHSTVDKATGGPDMGNIVDSTLIHKPMVAHDAHIYALFLELG